MKRMSIEDAFEHVALEIVSKRRNAELAQEYIRERPSLSTGAKAVKLLKASLLEEEAMALEVIVALARKG